MSEDHDMARILSADLGDVGNVGDSGGSGMSLVEVDYSDRAVRWSDGIPLLNRLGTRQREIEQHLVKLTLRTFEPRYLRRRPEVSGHPRSFLPNYLAQTFSAIWRARLFPDQVTGGFAQKSHHRGFLRTGNFSESSQHRLMFGQALPTL